MERVPVKSTTILEVGYDPDLEILEVSFIPGVGKPRPVWQYSDVTPEVHAEFMAAESIGGYFAKNIRTRYTAKKVG